MISVITPSFNKPHYVLEALWSVFNQTYTDWEHLVLDNSTDGKTDKKLALLDRNYKVNIQYLDFSPGFRQDYYVTAYLLNTWLPKLKGDFIFYLSDDDIIKPECFEKCINAFAQHPDWSVLYFGMRSVRGSFEKGWEENGFIGAVDIIKVGDGADCRIDGGQVMIRKSALEQLEKPYFSTSWKDASHCDGIFLTRLNQLFPFYPIPELLLNHRVTEVSTHDRSNLPLSS